LWQAFEWLRGRVGKLYLPILLEEDYLLQDISNSNTRSIWNVNKIDVKIDLKYSELISDFFFFLPMAKHITSCISYLTFTMSLHCMMYE
jgi:hypothetical protein